MSNGDTTHLLNKENVNVSALLDLYENVNVLFCVAEPTGYFTLLNPYWTVVLGWSVDELKSKPFVEFVHPDDRQATDVQADKQFVEHESVSSFINRYRTKAGDYRWLEWTAKSPSDGMIYAVAHDVTDKIEKERELKRVQERLQELVQNAPGAFFQYIANVDGTHSVQYMSPGSVDIWGLTAEEIGDDPTCLWAMVLPEDIEVLQKSVEESIHSLSRWEHEYRIKMPTGQIKWLRGIGNPRRLEDGSTFWNSLVMDLTQLREQQDTISRMQRMEMIGHLASGVSHDFNNILAIIDGHRQLIGMKTSDDTLKEHVDVMGGAIKRARQLTKRLLMSSKKKIVPTGQQISVSESMHEIRSLLDEITPPNIRVCWDIDSEACATIESSEFDDVVTNLFINARNALGKNGRISVSLKRAQHFAPSPHAYIHLSPGTARAYSVISVQDNGCGIKRDDFDKIFIPFVSNSKSGTGLGLAMAVGFATRNACGITLESTLGQGTIISIWLPEKSAVKADKIDEHPTAASSDIYRIALIDDEEDVLNVVSEMLRLKGHEVTTFNDSSDAREWLVVNQDSIDLILADEVMPGDVQGHHIYEEFKHALPVLIMSGYLDLNHYKRDEVEVLQKPVSIETLERSMHKAMQNKA